MSLCFPAHNEESTVRSVIEEAHALAVVSRSPFTEAERLIRARRAGYQFTFLPVEACHRQVGREHGASWPLVAEAMLDVARLWWALRHIDRVAAVRARGASDLPAST